MKTDYNTADDVLTAAKIDHGTALGNMILASIGIGIPLPKARAEVAVTGRAVGEAARFAAKNLKNQPAKEI